MAASPRLGTQPASPQAHRRPARIGSLLRTGVQLTTDGWLVSRGGRERVRLERCGLRAANQDVRAAEGRDGAPAALQSGGLYRSFQDAGNGRPGHGDGLNVLGRPAELFRRHWDARFIRLTNGLSKKAENHAHAVSLFFMHCNFCNAHTPLTKAASGIKATPAMASGLTDHVWTAGEILEKMKMSPAFHLLR